MKKFWSSIDHYMYIPQLLDDGIDTPITVSIVGNGINGFSANDTMTD